MGKYINNLVIYRDGEEEKVERKVRGSIANSTYFNQVIRVSWNIIGEI